MLTLIWRADGIAEVLAALDRGFGSVAGHAGHTAMRERPADQGPGARHARAAARLTQIHPGMSLLNDEVSVPNKQVAARCWPGRRALPRSSNLVKVALGDAAVRAQDAIAEAFLTVVCGADVKWIAVPAGVPMSMHQQIDFHVSLRCAIAA